jgi:hypothetical protein
MSALLVGSLNAGLLCPEVELSIGLAGAQLEANLTAALAIQASVSVTPPTLVAQLTAMLAVMTEIQAALQAGIALGLPGVSISVSAAATLVANAQLALGNLSILIALLGGPSMFVYSYSGGTVSTIGSDLSAGITASPPPGLLPSDPVRGLLVGASPGGWTGISPYFGGL